MRRKEFQYCTQKNELIETGDKDVSMARELLKMAEHREQFYIEVNQEHSYPSLYIEGHYEIIKELCTAILVLDGWKALNHECLFAYLRKKRQDLGLDWNYLLHLKDTRNAIDYRGVQVTTETWLKNKLKIMITINTLKEFIKTQV